MLNSELEFMKSMYIDPGTGSLLISALFAGLSVLFFLAKDKVYSLFKKHGNKGDYLNLDNFYNLVYYSEGKQYWNVFEPIISKGAEHFEETLYLTSDLEDPGLKAKFPNYNAIYIGTGKEAFFKLNHLKANMVIMTTPGLDVLEIKRSKGVKHYCHISHSTGGFGGYKAYATDYFDSVLVGGEGNYQIVRELENLRNLPQKDIEIIGNTYIDVFRQKLLQERFENPFFNNKLKTILISPTWGNHSLLASCGDELLNKLINSQKYNVIIRPHPQSFIAEKPLIDKLMIKYPNNEHVVWDLNRENLQAMHYSDLMISDFSGIIYDYYSLFKKPIITLHDQFEKRGRDAFDLKEEPWDIKYLSKIGKKITNNNLEGILEIIENVLHNFKNMEQTELINIMDKYQNQSAKLGFDFIKRTLSNLNLMKKKAEDLTDEPLECNSLNLKKFSLKQLGKVIFSTSFLFQIIMASVLMLIYIYVGIKFMPKGSMNYKFFISFKEYMLILTILLGLLFLVIIWFKNKGLFLYKQKFESAFNLDFLLLLFPMIVIFQYILANQDILDFENSLKVFLLFFSISLLIIIIIPTLISPIISKTFTIPFSLSFVFIFFNMGNFARKLNFSFISLLMLSIIIISLFLFLFDQKKLQLLIVFVFSITSLISSLNSYTKTNSNISQMPKPETNFLEQFEGKTIKNKPDVFLMIYDSYANQETLDEYGFDNTYQMNYLLNQGFAIYDGTYSLGYRSLFSISPLLNIEAREAIEGHTNEHRELISGQANGLKFFKKQGYINRFITEDDYFFKGQDPTYDSVFPGVEYSLSSFQIISNAILEGEFSTGARFSVASAQQLVQEKEKLLSSREETPQFIYHHLFWPNHSPYGELRPIQTELYFSRLSSVNETMQKDLMDINIPDRDIIVVIAGDHGPYLSKYGFGELGNHFQTETITRLDIQDRIGAFLAIYWPDESYNSKFNIRTIQDVLPAIISYMYEDDSLFEELRISNNVKPTHWMAGTGVNDGIIIGGINDKEPLFQKVQIRSKR